MDGEIFRAGSLTIDTKAHRVTRNGKEILLTRMEFMVLAYLVRNHGRVVPFRGAQQSLQGTAPQTPRYPENV
jgi:DNA-binding response OmpR family regulator